MDLTPGYLNGKGVRVINTEVALGPQTFFFFRTLTFLLSPGQLSCKMYPILDLSDYLLMIRFRLNIFGNKAHNVRLNSYWGCQS